MTRLQDVREPLERFRALFGAHLPEGDRMDFYANRVTPEGETFLRLETYATPVLSRLVLEEYVIGGRMRGAVIMAIPRPETEAPVFFFQLGGVGDRSIAVLDISPTTPDLDLSPLAPVHEEYARRLGLEPTHLPWLQTVCSPYLLHCAYKELDEALYVEAMADYCRLWIDRYYLPALAAEPTARGELTANAIYKFKYQLHHHDPAYDFFAKSWGKATADAFLDLECGDPPAMLPPVDLGPDIKPWHDVDRRLVWDADAQLTVMGAEPARWEGWRASVEERAAAEGLGIITPALLERYGSMP
jgi:hypothetical protein